MAVVTTAKVDRWFLLVLLWLTTAHALDPSSVVNEATPEEIRAFLAGQNKKVLTFVGYSGAGYENPEAMLKEAARILDEHDANTTIVNTGATPEGIGAIYKLAKARGFQTMGIVSTQAKENNTKLSGHIDVLFFVRDRSWGGFIPGTESLSPTSRATVENSDRIVAIGGGEVARDELLAAKRAGKPIQFIPAEMDHRNAKERALKKGEPAPMSYEGAAGAVFGNNQK